MVSRPSESMRRTNRTTTKCRGINIGSFTGLIPIRIATREIVYRLIGILLIHRLPARTENRLPISESQSLKQFCLIESLDNTDFLLPITCLLFCPLLACKEQKSRLHAKQENDKGAQSFHPCCIRSVYSDLYIFAEWLLPAACQLIIYVPPGKRLISNASSPRKEPRKSPFKS